MKKIVFASLTMVCVLSAMAQKEIKYAKIFYKDFKVETSDLTISIDNAVSTDAETKFKLKITNKTSDYIIYKPEESKFVINGKELKPAEKWLVISPNDSDFKIINLKGTEYNTIKSYSFVVDGLYKVSARIQGVPAPDFKLPASQNDFKAGNFSCSLGKLSKESDKTDVKFECAYNGEKIGFVFPSRVAVKMPDGKDYANAKSKAKVIMLLKGEKDTFTLQWDRMEGGKSMDMQLVDMFIKWNESFVEASPEKMKSETLELAFDETMSNEKGKK
ncbi:MAG: hypothetical protein ACT4ON_16350 [Bacteroidota bacterium]